MYKPNKGFQSPFYRPNADQMAAMPAVPRKTVKGILAGTCVQKNSNVNDQMTVNTILQGNKLNVELTTLFFFSFLVRVFAVDDESGVACRCQTQRQPKRQSSEPSMWTVSNVAKKVNTFLRSLLSVLTITSFISQAILG